MLNHGEGTREMRKRYREKIYKCGEYLEVDIFPVFAQGNRRRRAKYKPTSAMQEKLNQRHAEQELTRILNANFTSRDISATLTYDRDSLPETLAEAMRDVKNFLRRVKRLRAKKGLSEMKYVLIPGGGRYHFHVPMSGGISAEELAKLWGKGYCNVIHFRFNENGLEGHARYTANQYDEDLFGGEDLLSGFDLDEETGELTEREGNKVRKKGARRYICSKNIVRPEAEVREGKISAAKVEELATVDSASRREFEKIYQGYSFSECVPYFNEENGGYYLRVKMFKNDAAFLYERKRFRERR